MKSKKARELAICLTVSILVSMTACSSKGEQSVVEESSHSQIQAPSEASESALSNVMNSSIEESTEDTSITIVEEKEESQKQDFVAAEAKTAQNDGSANTMKAGEKSTIALSHEDSAEEATSSVEVGNDAATNMPASKRDEQKSNSMTSSVDLEMSQELAGKSDTSLGENESISTSTDDTADEELEELSAIDNKNDGLNNTQRNAINMLNYMTVLTQEINDSKQSRMFLDEAYDSIINNIYPNAVDSKTQSQIDSILDTLHQYQMLTVKRERLEYLYEQNKAQALRQAIPNPIGLLSAVQSGSLLKAAASVIYMGVDSVTSYKAASTQADLQYLKDGWELDDAEAEEIHKSRTSAFNYMLKMVNDNDLPGDYALSEDAVEEFVAWKNKTNLVSKVQWLESNRETYERFGPYWLELAKDYYDSERYEDCLDAFEKYGEVATRIFRKDTDYSGALPMAILAAKETMSRAKYNGFADKYAAVALKNTDDWTVRYFVAQVYIDLYKNTKDKKYIDAAYQIALDNVNELVDEQKTLNETYLADVKKVTAEAGATKQQKKDVKQYNKMLKENRKIELPPVSEALYLNCDLLFALLEERGMADPEKKKIDGILHEDGSQIFLTTALDEKFRFDSSGTAFDTNELNGSFDGKKISIPASCISDRSTIEISVSGKSGENTITDWTVKQVERPKDTDCSGFMVSYVSDTAQKYEYTDGDVVTVRIVPVAESPEEVIELSFKAVQEKKLYILKGIAFERK